MMMPWLVIPLIILWALSQMLPPGFRFERRDLLRERRRIAALEAAKWRKEATHRCRNCLTAYKDQNPAGGRFMCTYCGHVSRRPVLDISNVAIHGNSDGIAASGAPLPASIAQSGIGDLGFSGNLYLM